MQLALSYRNIYKTTHVFFNKWIAAAIPHPHYMGGVHIPDISVVNHQKELRCVFLFFKRKAIVSHGSHLFL